MTETYRDLLNDMKPLPWGLDSLRSILHNYDARALAILKWVQAADEIVDELESCEERAEQEVSADEAHDFVCTECGDYLARIDKRGLVPGIYLRLDKSVEELEQVPLDQLTKEQMLPLLISLVIENEKLRISTPTAAQMDAHFDDNHPFKPEEATAVLEHARQLLNEVSPVGTTGTLTKAKRSCELHDDCAAADVAAEAQGQIANHCLDPMCSDCLPK